MFSRFEIPTRQMLTGNLLLVVCCVFYLAWWLIAFKPKGAIKGFKSGWLLIPAFIFGFAAVMQIVRGSNVSGELLLPRNAVLSAFIVPAFRHYGTEVGVLAIIMMPVMLQRHLPGMKNIRTGTEPKKDLMKKLRRRGS